MTDSPRRATGRPWRPFAAILAVVALLAGIELTGLRVGRPSGAPVPATPAAAAADPAPAAASPAAATAPKVAAAALPVDASAPKGPAALPVDAQAAAAQKSLPARWSALLDAHPALAGDRFFFLMMTSGVSLGGAGEIDQQYRDLTSRTQVVGMSVPVLYLRTTLGSGRDWVFDPAFDLARKCGERRVVDDNLDELMRYAVAHRLPVQFILNGGIWSDASCEIPQWDLTDHLEQDRANVQWTQRNEVFPDAYLKGLAGSTTSPELARSLTYHVYARSVRHYKKRNLQAAARRIAQFARAHPQLFVGVVLDADTYMNPFFRGEQVFDYNPGMLRQFREWLRGSGPYAGKPRDGAPDLSRYRRREPLTLAQVNAIARRHWARWQDVDPPRDLPGMVGPVKPGETPIWKDPWWNLWDAFRKHIVGLHYDELSTWTHEAGIPRERIFSAQGLVHNDPEYQAFAIAIDSPSREYDSAGVSLQGALPRDGHLGAVLYGRTARNAITLDNGRSLFATIGRMDDGWGIVEYNNTDLKYPNVPPDYAMAYHTFRDAFNYGAREVSAMAWNGSNGIFVGQAGYAPWTAWRNTPAEAAMRDFLVTHADVPHGARLWTFGTPRHADADGWTAEAGSLAAGPGEASLVPSAGAVTLLSPPDQVLRARDLDRLVLVFQDAAPARVKVEVEADGRWQAIGEAAPSGTAPSETATGGTVRGAGASREIPLRWPATLRPGMVAERLRLTLAFAPSVRQATLRAVLLYPAVPR